MPAMATTSHSGPAPGIRGPGLRNLSRQPTGFPMTRRTDMTRGQAEVLAIEALRFLAEEPERLGRFLALSGLEAQSLRDAAREPNFLLGVLDHLVGDERLLRQFSDQQEIAPEVVTRAFDLLAEARPEAP
jgi:hypothetical protein